MSVRCVEDLELTNNEYAAIATARERLLGRHGIVDIVLFGSVARGEADEESDIDLLILTETPLSREERHIHITDVVCEINLEYETNLSTLVIDRKSWTHGPSSLLPLHDEVLRDGIPL